MKLRQRLAHLRAALSGRNATTGAFQATDTVSARLLRRWLTEITDPNEPIRWSLMDWRAQARSLADSNGEAAGLLLDFETDIVGPVGAQLQMRARTNRGTERAALNERVERRFRRWARRGMCTTDGSASFASLQRLMIRTVIRDGEFVALRQRDPDAPFGYRLQPVDADQIDETYNVAGTATQNAIVLGVEIDRVTQAPVTYWLWDRHPSLPGRTRIPVPARDVLHVFKRLRAGQVRGIPWFAPAIVTWKLGDRYTEAELYQSLLAAAQGGFFVNKDGSGPEIPRDPSGKVVPIVMEAEPGSARMLPAGYEFQEWKPTHPTANYVGFMKAVKRIIGRAFGRSYASLTGDLSDVNFSSMRTDRVRETEQNRVHQHELLGEQFCDVVLRDWLTMQVVMGTLGPVALSVDDMLDAATWMFRGWPWIDPLKDAAAANMELSMGTNSPQRICAEKGRDFYDIVDELAEARAYCAEKNVPLEAVPLAVTVAVTQDADTSENDTSAEPARNRPPLRAVRTA